VIVEAGQSEVCRVDEKLAKYGHARQLVQRTSGHATNLSMSRFNGFWSRPGESEFEFFIFFFEMQITRKQMPCFRSWVAEELRLRYGASGVTIFNRTLITQKQIIPK
jgi:hypothetical protein